MERVPSHYRGRFAPSPTGPLHAGSLVAALASWLDARAHDGVWLLRIEDVDTPRCRPEAVPVIVAQLAACGLVSDEPPLFQSQRGACYQAALDRLIEAGCAYPCGCSRREIEQANAALGRSSTRAAELVYPGTCRAGLDGRPLRAWRFRVAAAGLMSKNAYAQAEQAQSATDSVAQQVDWQDRRLGPQTQDVAASVGDFVLKRADGVWAYQLAVVADDAAQRIGDVVRGEDLADNTARQILLQRALGLPSPRYLHTPLVRAADGAKLSKQHGAAPIESANPLLALNRAAARLGLPTRGASVSEALAGWIGDWRLRYGRLNPGMALA